ncbi:MAG: hypothetical protein B7Z81_13530 [Acidocella sp. 20-61-6]|nr:MAG: hypothetical protein B7Z81_13530 [Acidocella sp. 20-61-6]
MGGFGEQVRIGPDLTARESRDGLIYEERVTKPNAAQVVARLESAGATLLALPGRGHSTKLRQMRFDIVHTALEAYGWAPPPLRAPTPGATAISDMDTVIGWLRFIPDGNFVMRRVVGARALVHPLTCRHLFTWRRLGATLRADHKSVQRWHGQGVAMIVAGLLAEG